MMKTGRDGLSSVCAARGLFLFSAGVAMSVAMSATWARAEPSLVVARNNELQRSEFSLNFGDFGGVSSAPITQTDFILSSDCAAGDVAFADYQQDIGELLLPGPAGPVSTGNIHVEIVESMNGSCDAETGAFTTSDMYAIHFDGDLSAYQIESPFYLPGASTGTVEYDDEQTGRVQMNWSGTGYLPSPIQPGEYIGFGYVCRVSTVFVVPGLGDVDADRDVDLADFAAFQNCHSGRDYEFGTARCLLADFDADTDVDVTDYRYVELNQTGPREQ